jgi:hemerythrin-like domain-containing protein
LRASREAASALECLDKLEGDHKAAAKDHATADSLGTRWLTGGKLSSEQALALSQALTRLSGLYARHIAIEDTELFPLAAKVLQEGELAAVGREMADRRGVRNPRG